ncbi:MAG: Rad2 nuclease [Alectoria sarmentosa]|nr:MAG: Rad2 nuclease [Alectoria sarmentosa]
MGISGLLPLLKSIQKPCNLKKFAGETVGVDAYGWLHRGTVACAIDLALGKPTTKHIDFSMHRVRMLIHFGVIPYIVFDGDFLPSKAATEVERAKRREESKRKGLEFYRLNKPSQAHLELQKAVDVTPEMARQLIEELKKAGIQYVVAPYEADAQLAYLERQGIIQGMLSEDSDLLVFGAKRLLTKLDQYGDCIEINRADFTACREISLVGWSDADFRRMAILSGCDYLASINRMGLKSAYRLVRKYKTIEKILRILSFDGQYHIPPGYLEAFHKAELTFLHQRVFCPLKKDVVMMTDLQADAQPEDFSFIGAEVEQEIAMGVAKGDLDPMTKQPIRVKDTVKTTPRTPWNNPRRNTIDTYPDTKAVKPIDSIFKPKRTALAELDPNSFKPSPTQGRLLRQANGVTWESSSAPAGPPTLRPSPSMPFGPRSALSNRVSETVTSVGAAPTRPTASKRRRLCIDPSDSLDSENVVASESGRSRFFTPNTTDLSPSMKRSEKNRKGKSADITIWSDDSVEDLMAELPEVTGCPRPSSKGKMEIFRDDTQETAEDDRPSGVQDDEIAREDSQYSIASRGTVESERSSSTSATTFTSSALSVATTLDKNVTAELKALAQKYTYQPETERMKLQRREMESSKELRAGAIVSRAISKPPIFRQRSVTPLARLGLCAMKRSRYCGGLSNNGVSGPGSVKESASNQGITHVMKAVPEVALAYSVGPDASMTKGSEDAIIPGSEDEGESASEIEEPIKAKVDFRRFVFTG